MQCPVGELKINVPIRGRHRYPSKTEQEKTGEIGAQNQCSNELVSVSEDDVLAIASRNRRLRSVTVCDGVSHDI